MNVSYQWAKDHHVILKTVKEWLKKAKHLSHDSKRKILGDWKENKLMLVIDDRGSLDLNKEDVTRRSDYEHYLMAYMRGVFKL